MGVGGLRTDAHGLMVGRAGLIQTSRAMVRDAEVEPGFVGIGRIPDDLRVLMGRAVVVATRQREGTRDFRARGAIAR